MANGTCSREDIECSKPLGLATPPPEPRRGATPSAMRWAYHGSSLEPSAGGDPIGGHRRIDGSAFRRICRSEDKQHECLLPPKGNKYLRNAAGLMRVCVVIGCNVYYSVFFWNGCRRIGTMLVQSPGITNAPIPRMAQTRELQAGPRARRPAACATDHPQALQGRKITDRKTPVGRRSVSFGCGTPK